MSCATTWMHLEIAVLYEVGEKDKYCVTSSIAELKMIEMNLLIKQTHRLNEFMVTEGKERTSLVAQMVKRLPTMRETWVQSLGWEDPLEKEMTTYPSTLTWKIPWMEEHGSHQSMGSQSQTLLSDFTFTFKGKNGESNSRGIWD